MKFRSLLALFILFISSPCSAGGVDDFKVAEDLWEKGIYENSVVFYRKAIDSGELSEQQLVKAYYNIATILFIRYQPNDTIAVVDKILGLQPDHIGAYSLRADAYDLLGEDNMALADWAKILELDPTDFLAYHNRAYFYASRKQFDKALLDIDICLMLKGTIPERIEDLVKLRAKLVERQ